MSASELFLRRVLSEWLPTYSSDPRRGYGTDGFVHASIKVSEADALDCMLAVDQGVISDTGGGRYRAARSAAHEVLFWEGGKSKSPRPITLWLEPVITFAALGRLHARHGWPREMLGTQPPTWAFDLIACRSEIDDSPKILGEVKKSAAELGRLNADILCLAEGGDSSLTLINSRKKWAALLATRPTVLWLLGPAEEQHVYLVSYTSVGASLAGATVSALAYNA